MNKTVKISLFFITLILVGIFVIYYLGTLPPKKDIDFRANMVFELGVIKSDLETYNKLSDETIGDILKTLRETAIHDTLPVGLLHCINRVESEYQFNIIHPTVTVPVRGKMVTTNAVGTGGILWCYWGDSLKARKIAQMESDLFFPVKSIRATGFILRFLINDENRIAKLNGEKLTPMNILSKVVKRYYGALSEMYLARMQQVTSDLWMKRMAFEIMGTIDTTVKYVIKNKETTKTNKMLQDYIDKNIKEN